MIELSRHIETLLLENDCVIVPDFGGFVAHYNPATYSEEEHLFLPPARTIGFNPQLKMNDGLLVQSYMSVYGTNFADATRMVDKDVRSLVACLHENGKAELPNIGEISYTIHATYNFAPYDNRVTTPELYGLDCFEMKPLASLRKTEVRKAPVRFPDTEVKPSRYRRSGRRMLKLSRTYLSNAVAAVAAIILFFMFSIPVENTEIIQGNYAQLLPSEMFEQMKEQSLVLTPVVTPQSGKQKITAENKTGKAIKPTAVREVKVKAAGNRPKAPAEASEPQRQTETKTVAKKPYHIIVASMGTEKDARDMADRLKKEGYRGASAIIGDGKMRVSIESFATRAEAYQSLQVIREQEAYQSAWILKY